MTPIGATSPTATRHQVTVHADGPDRWGTCACGWTSSFHSPDPLEVQARKHERLEAPWATM